MNFFGHGVVSTWFGTTRAFYFGAMVPDFFAMAGLTFTASATGEVGAGIALHHRTDDLFHQSPVFTALQRESFQYLERTGLDRGPSRAIAHVGIEILIDAVLCREEAARVRYLDVVKDAECIDAVQFARAEHRPKIAEIVQRLGNFGVDLHHVSTDVLGDRVTRTLTRRPRLAVPDSMHHAVRAWAAEFHPRTEARIPELMTFLREGLSRELP